MKKDVIFRMMNIDPRISRIDKILAKFWPKFLDLYASIYGTYQKCKNTVLYTWDSSIF